MGKYGRMRKTYLKEHRPILYNQMLLSEKLYPHLLEIDETAQSRLEQMTARHYRQLRELCKRLDARHDRYGDAQQPFYRGSYALHEEPS